MFKWRKPKMELKRQLLSNQKPLQPNMQMSRSFYMRIQIYPLRKVSNKKEPNSKANQDNHKD